MSQPTAAPAFQSRASFLLIAAFPGLFTLSKFVLWERYGVFDFHSFHLAGLLANAGQIDQLYKPDVFSAQYLQHYGEPGQLPWFYPPLLLPYCQFLALFSVAVAFLVNGFISIAAYYLAVRWVFPDRSRDIIILSALPLIIALGFGHPIILFLSLLLIGYRLTPSSLGAGLLALTLCAAKPHLGGVALFLLFSRKLPKSLLPSTLIGISIVLIFAALYGWQVWWLFLQSISLAATYLEGGTINQQWISSLYAGALALNTPRLFAIMAQGSGLILFCSIGAYLFRHEKQDQFWVVAGLAAVFTSPYLMYYDLIFLLFPLALVVKRVHIRIARSWVYGLFLSEVGFLVLLAFKPAAPFGFLVFAAFTTMLFIGKARYAHRP